MGTLTLTSASRFSAATGMAVAEVARLRAVKKKDEKRMVVGIGAMEIGMGGGFQ
jgi:hypothetical protein